MSEDEVQLMIEENAKLKLENAKLKDDIENRLEVCNKLKEPIYEMWKISNSMKTLKSRLIKELGGHFSG